MTTIQLAARLARHLSTPDLATMPGPAQLDIVDAINAAIGEVFPMLPGHYRRTTCSETLKTPRTVNFAFSARYDTELTSSPFLTSETGCTVRLGDDQRDNEITAANAVLDGYLGSAFSGTATIYHDAAGIFEVVERVTGRVVAEKLDGTRTLLSHNPEIRRYKRQIGTPTEYMLDPVGAVQGSEPVALLRVHPMPDVDYIIRFDAELSSIHVTWAQIQGAGVNIPVPNRIAESSLLPIAREKLTASTFWGQADAIPAIRAMAQSGRALLMTLPQNITGNNTVRTEAGF